MYSQSQDKREQILVQLVHDPAIPMEYLCRKCGYTSKPPDVERHMIRHLRSFESVFFLSLLVGVDVWVLRIESRKREKKEDMKREEFRNSS